MAQEVLRDGYAGIGDLHQDISGTAVNFGKNHLLPHDPNTLLRTPNGSMEQLNMTSVPGLEAGGFVLVGAVMFITPLDMETGEFVPQNDFLGNLQEHYQVYKELLEARPDILMQVKTKEDLLEAQAAGKIGLVLSVEDWSGLPSSPDETELNPETKTMIDIAIDEYGVRIADLVYTYKNNIGDTATAGDEDQGLTPFGKALGRYLKSRGVMLSTSHAGPKTAMDMVELEGGAATIACHSGDRETTDHPRNNARALSRAIAERGGIIGVPAVATFIKNTETGRATIEEYVDHLEALDEEGLFDHVGMGSDADGIYPKSRVEGMDDVVTMRENLIAAMSRRPRFTTEKINSFLSGNIFRVLQENLPSRKSTHSETGAIQSPPVHFLSAATIDLLF